MDTAYLRAFALVVETGSLAEAARRLNVTPAAVSLQVQVLERELGTKLLGRAGRTVSPTEAGTRLAARCPVLLREIDGLREWVNEADPSGELRVGTINTALHGLLPEALARFTADHPRVSVYIRSGMSDELYEAVKQSEVDAAVCLHPPFAMPKAMAWELLRQEPLVVLAPAADRGADPHELLRTRPLVRYDRGVGGGRQADQYLRRAGITPPFERFEVASLLAIAMMVERGLGVSVVPDIGSPLTAALRVVSLPLPMDFEPRRFGMLWRRTSPRASLIQAFMEQARRAAGASVA